MLHQVVNNICMNRAHLTEAGSKVMTGIHMGLSRFMLNLMVSPWFFSPACHLSLYQSTHLASSDNDQTWRFWVLENQIAISQIRGGADGGPEWACVAHAKSSLRWGALLHTYVTRVGVCAGCKLPPRIPSQLRGRSPTDCTGRCPSPHPVIARDMLQTGVTYIR